MTVAKMKREMKRLNLSQGDVAEMMGITQPTVSNILSSEHELTERNAEAFVRGVARLEATRRVAAYPDMANTSVLCHELTRRLPIAEYLKHLDTCPACMTRSFLMSALPE
jgi:predicted transcriptional regulator